MVANHPSMPGTGRGQGVSPEGSPGKADEPVTLDRKYSPGSVCSLCATSNVVLSLTKL